MLRNRRGATSLRWLRALLDHGIEVHGQVVVCPGVNDGAVLDDTLAGVLDRYPELAVAVRRAARRQPLSTRAAHARPHARRRRAAVVDCVEDWQDVFLRGARPPARVRGRRVLPAGRAPVPGRRGLRGLPDARGRHRHGPHASSSSCTARRGRADRRRRPGFFAWVDGAPGRGLSSPPRSSPGGGAADQLLPSAVATAPVGDPHRRRTARGCSRRLVAALGRDDVRVIPVRQRVLRRQHRRRPACWWGRTSPACSPPSPQGHRYLLPDVCLSERPVPRRHLRRPARARSRSSPPTASRSARRWA